MKAIDRLYRLLLVDDDRQLLVLLEEFLKQFYHVDAVSNGAAALERLARQPYDLVISDINMPGMMGYELLGRVRAEYPKTKTALITAWSIEDFIRNVLKYNIGNIISKNVPFDFEELHTTVETLLSGEVFGLERYLQPGAKTNRKWVQNARQLTEVRDEVIRTLVDDRFDEHRRMTLRLILDESLSNAAYHPHGYPKGRAFDLPKEKAVVVDYGRDDVKIGIAVSDQIGKLTQRDILTSLHECVYPTEESLLREGGRGLFLMHSMVDRLIINIQPGCRTELILLLDVEGRERGHRPLLIHEI